MASPKRINSPLFSKVVAHGWENRAQTRKCVKMEGEGEAAERGGTSVHYEDPDFEVFSDGSGCSDTGEEARALDRSDDEAPLSSMQADLSQMREEELRPDQLGLSDNEEEEYLNIEELAVLEEKMTACDYRVDAGKYRRGSSP